MGNDHLKTVEAQFALARAHNYLNQYGKALPLAEQAVKASATLYGEQHEETLRAERCRAISLSAMDADAGMQLRQEILERSQASLGGEHPVTLTILGDLAWGHFSREEYKQAASLYEEVLRLRRSVLGNENPETLDAISQLSFCYRRSKQYEKALPLAQESLEASLRVLGATHRGTVRATDRLADALEGLGRITESLELREIAMEKRKVRAGPELSNFNISAAFLIGRYGMFGYHDRCAEMGQAFVKSMKKKYGETHQQSINAMKSTSFALTGRPGADRASVQRAIGYAREICESNPDSADYHVTLGIALFRAQKWHEASNVLKHTGELNLVEEKRKKLFLAMTQWHLGDKDQARKLLDDALGRLDKEPSRDAWLPFIVAEARELVGGRTTVEAATHE